VTAWQTTATEPSFVADICAAPAVCASDNSKSTTEMPSLTVHGSQAPYPADDGPDSASGAGGLGEGNAKGKTPTLSPIAPGLSVATDCH